MFYFIMLTVVWQIALISNPLVILTFLVVFSLSASKIFMVFNNSTWPGLFLILIYAGGMLVLFLFLIAMCPNFQINPLSMNLFIVILSLLMIVFSNTMENKAETMVVGIYSKNWFMVVVATLLLSAIMILVSTLLYNPKASLKTTNLN